MSSALDLLSLTTAPIEIFASDGTRCGSASGFFYGHDNAHAFYVTNWHVVTARNSNNPSVVRHDWKAPVQAKLRLHTKTGAPNSISMSQKTECIVEINDSSGDKPKWLEHPKLGHQADVVVLKLLKTDLDANVTYKTISECQLSPDYKESVMDDVFVVGYPWGLDGGDGVLPLYKRGSIASEPSINCNRLPKFLIDCRTAKSMSGSPVICSHSGVWMPNGKMDILGTVNKFVGVYSGRLIERDADGGQEPAATDIGQVWKKDIIDEILAANTVGKPLSNL